MLKQTVSALALGLCLACASGPEIPKSQQPTQANAEQVQTLYEKATELYAKATGKADVMAALAAFEEVLAADPGHRDALVRASMLRYYEANNVIGLDGDKDQLMAAYLKGREYGLRAMATNPTFRQAYEQDNDMVKQVPLLQKDDAPGLFWAAVNWAKWGELYGILRAAIDIPKVKAMMERVNALDPTYQGNAADRFFMGYWVAIPGFAGRDPNKSKAAFEKASAESPQCLANAVTYAFYYGRDQEDRALFETLLKKVIDAPAPADDDPLKLLNGLAKEEAALYLTRTKEWFDE